MNGSTWFLIDPLPVVLTVLNNSNIPCLTSATVKTFSLLGCIAIRGHRCASPFRSAEDAQLCMHSNRDPHLCYFDAAGYSVRVSRFKGSSVNRFLTVLLAIGFWSLLVAPAIQAQAGPASGEHELQVWTGGGHGLNGSTSDTGIWNLGARYGWVLTNPIGPGPLRGRFEYAVDVVPVFLLTQRNGTAYGFGLDPFALKWNFAVDHKVTPYAEISGGTLFSNIQVPPGTSRVNFTSSGALGLHFPRSKYNWSAEVRFMHISNAGLTSPNPGINTIQVRIGFGRFTQPK